MFIKPFSLAGVALLDNPAFDLPIRGNCTRGPSRGASARGAGAEPPAAGGAGGAGGGGH